MSELCEHLSPLENCYECLLERATNERDALARVCEDVDDALNDWPSEHAGRLAQRVAALKRERNEALDAMHKRYDLIPLNEKLCGENARLRAALQSIANSACCEGCQEAALVAKTALGDTPKNVAPFADLPESPKRDKALRRWASGWKP